MRVYPKPKFYRIAATQFGIIVEIPNSAGSIYCLVAFHDREGRMKPLKSLYRTKNLFKKIDRKLQDGRAMQLTEEQVAGLLMAQLLPIDPSDMHVWCCGVTWLLSQIERNKERAAQGHASADVQLDEEEETDYDRVGNILNPNEIFEKATEAEHCVIHGQPVGIRTDSGWGERKAWDVPELELALIVSGMGRILGFMLGLDMSSRSLEGCSTLLLTQAKVYRHATGLSQWVYVPEDPYELWPIDLNLAIEEDGVPIFDVTTDTRSLRRTYDEMIKAVMRCGPRKGGGWNRPLTILTGTGIIPTTNTKSRLVKSGENFSLCAGRHVIKSKSDALELELNCGVEAIDFRPEYRFTPGASPRFVDGLLPRDNLS